MKSDTSYTFYIPDVVLQIRMFLSICVSLPVVRPSISSSDSGKEDVTVLRGLDITLQCEADGVPRPAITWLKDGRPISSGSGAQILNEGRLLRLRDAKVVDTGRYTCIAVNEAGQTESKFDITVHGEQI